MTTEVAENRGAALAHTLDVRIESDAPFTSKIITHFSDLEKLSASWERICEADPKAEIFHTFEWNRAICKNLGGGVSLCAVVVYAGTEVVGIVPLALRGNNLQFLGSPASDYNDVLCYEDRTAEVLRSAFEALLHSPVRWTSCILDNVPEHSRLMRFMGTLPSEVRERLQLHFKSPCPTILLNGKPDGKANTRFRKQSVQRHEKRLRKLGRLSFRHLETREEIRQHLDSFFRQHVQRLAFKGQKSHFLCLANRQFYSALVDELDPRRQLRFSVLSLNELPIAYHFGFQHKDKFIWYQPTFNVDYWDYSPGEVLLAELLRYAQQHSLREFDFTVGGERYKDRFANETRQLFTVCIDSDSRFVNHFVRVQRRCRAALRKTGFWLFGSRRVHSLARSWRLKLTAALAVTRSVAKPNHWFAGLAAIAAKLVRRWFVSWDNISICTLNEREDKNSGNHADVEINPMILSEIASLSVDHPNELHPLKLQILRERLKAGDQVFAVRDCHSVFQILSVRIEPSQRYFRMGDLALAESPLACVIYDTVILSRTGEDLLPSRLLRSVTSEYRDSSVDLGIWMNCPIRNKSKDTALVRRRVLTIRCLEWIRSSSNGAAPRCRKPKSTEHRAQQQPLR
jgi:CelD/BcsL family acetyltransferase involved in cellulose biosynthesis